MLPLIAGTIPDFSRSLGSVGAARHYAATRAGVEAAPVTAPEAGTALKRRAGQRGQRQTLSRHNNTDPHKGQNVDMEV